MFKTVRIASLIAFFSLNSILSAQKSDFFEVAKQLEIYTSAYKELNMYYMDELNPAEMNEIALKALFARLDPYTNYYDEQGIEDVRIQRSGEYGGIGTQTRFKEHHLYILEVYKDGPAAKAGLQAGDEIIQINDVNIKDYDEEESVTSLLRGLPDTTVNIKILRQGKEMSFNVGRSKIEMNSVPFYGMVDAEVGYISFVKFNQKASAEVKNAYAELMEKGMKKLIIDVRSNPGGLLNEAVNITNFFIPKDQVVVITKGKVKKWSNTYKTKNEPIHLEIPLVILIDDRSASASEILSGSLQDYDRAVIMGERSFGKGLVQRYRDLPYGTQMKLTISKYYTPSGRCIQELDYTNRDKEGNVPKFSEGKVNEFKTANGRKVTDGGGVLPDVIIDRPETLELTKKLYASDAFFNFITQYFYSHPGIAEAKNFQLDSSIYEDLKKYLINNLNEFDTATDKTFEKAMESAKKEGFYKDIAVEYNQFKMAVALKKIEKLEQNKEEIIERLTEEIVRRYYYREGEYEQKMAHDPVIVQAAQLLNDKNKYAKLLK
jgi:carboxyl-terminal processing protease